MESEHAVAFGGWVAGFAILLVAVAAVTVAGRGLRRRLLPGWRGPEAALASSVLAVAVLVVAGQIVGTFGLFDKWWLAGLLVILAVLAEPSLPPLGGPTAGRDDHAGGRIPYGIGDHTAEDADPSGLTGDDRSAGAPAESGWARLAALVGVTAAATAWLGHVVAVYQRGSTDGDSLMYHLPFAARFVQTGVTSRVVPVGPDAWVAFYPANAELLEAQAMLPFHHEALVPALNLGWLAVALLAGWCLGRRGGHPSVGVLMAALVMTLPIMVATQAGTARVDAMVVALILACVALLVVERRTTGSVAVAGVALGLAMGTKFVALPFAGILTVGVAVLLWRRLRPAAAGWWLVAVAVPAAYWYVRNWAVAGSPLPLTDLKIAGWGFGSLPDDRLAELEGTALSGKLGGLPGFQGQTLWPAVEIMAGTVAFAAIVAVVAVAAGVLVVRTRPFGVRHVAVVAAVAALVAYVFAPNSAPVFEVRLAGEIDERIVALNARYLLPGLGVLLCLLPVGLAGLARRGRILAEVVAVAAAAYLVYLTPKTLIGHGEWAVQGSDTAAGFVTLAVGAAVVAAVVLQARRHAAAGGRAPSRAPAVALAAAAVLVGAGTRQVTSGHGGLHRYEPALTEYGDLWDAGRALHGQKVGLLGEWLQFPYVGEDLTNDVDFLVLPPHDGVGEVPLSCDEIRRSLAGGGYDAVVVQRGLFSIDTRWLREVGCVTGIPGADVQFTNEVGAIVGL
ncbi:MAG TPA: hypothetical protein VFI47_01120 [Acidimicrobiales bacterium]|nr:hypothetical protein [Acidimicrobiales bacterium]